MKKIVPLVATTLLTFPLLASAADIIITNNTDHYGTGSIYGTCSNSFGDSGVIKPGQTVTVPEAALNMLCFGMTCTAKIYLNNSCSGDVVATAKIDPKKGIKQINNRDTANFSVSWTATTVVVERVPH